MKIIISTKGTQAIYEQIVNQIKNEIITGQLKPGESLPSIRALANELEVSVITTKRAYEELEKENLARSVPGKGFYVCECSSGYLKEKSLLNLEQRMTEVITECRQAGLTKEEIMELFCTLVETDT